MARSAKDRNVVSPALVAAVSPYHLATREAAAMAALVIATRCVTLLPHPAAGDSREAVAAAVKRAPRYLRLMESWRWSSALWRAGVVAGRVGAEQPDAEILQVYADIRNDGASGGLAELKPLTRRADALADEKPDAFLDAVSADLVRGGPDPGINIPVNAALERFSGRHGLVMVRSGATSVAQRAEARLGRKVFAVAVPVLVQAGAERLLLLRHDLSRPLRELRTAMVKCFEAPGPEAGEAVSAAAHGYAQAFKRWADAGSARGDDETGKRVVATYVGITGMMMPADAVLRSSRAAVRAVGGYAAARRAGPAAGEAASAAMQPTLVIREMNATPEL